MREGPTWLGKVRDVLMTLPLNVEPRVLRFYVLSNFACLAGALAHGGYFIPLFAYLDVPLLLLHNVGSTLLFSAGLVMLRKGWVSTVFLLGFLEVATHAWVAIRHFGWESGFHYYLLVYALMFFLTPFRMRNKILLCAVNGLIYIALFYDSRGIDPWSPQGLDTLGFLNTANLLTTIAIFSVITHYFNVATLRAESALEKEYERSEGLLLNILPGAVAAELKAGKEIIVERYDCVTVLFSDIVGFTRLSSKLSPSELITMLNGVFSIFDDTVEKYGAEKIKTIGDAYMLAGGVPLPLENHAEAVVRVGLEMQRRLADFNEEHGPELMIRIGIHTGPVVAGVIGNKKFVYDVWGDTVNIASRLESLGEGGRVQVSEATRALLEGRFEFEDARTVQVKGRGPMQVCFLKDR